MKRRDFIKNAGVASAAAFAVPYILPSGRLFAATGSRKVNHVVFCMFAGGVRNIETVHQGESNLMTNMLKDVSGGFTPQTGIDKILPSSPLGSSRLQEFGTFYKEMRFSQGSTGHYSGHLTAMTGRYNTDSINLRANPDYPTIFEYYRKHGGSSGSIMDATNSWWISDALGPYPLLNYSSYGGYGAAYGANYIQPNALISQDGYEGIGDPKEFSAANDALSAELKGFCDGTFGSQFNLSDVGVVNSASDKVLIKNFLDELFQGAITTPGYDSWGFGGEMNNDLRNVYYAEEVLKKFQPELTVLNMQGVDICHSNFTSYCNNIRKADWGVAHLWDTIQSTPGLQDDTVLIVMPEHGRNIEPNTLVDAYGRPAFDHTGDDTSREVFALVCGPSGVINQNKVISTVEGECVDIVPTIANLLGFDVDIPAGLLHGSVLNSAMV